MKDVIVHIGPHKTGSTSIQMCLTENSDYLANKGIRFLHNKETLQAATLLSKEFFDEAEEKLTELSTLISSQNLRTIILSQEDFSGNLIGRTSKRRIYPKLTKNMRVISRALRPHNVRFVFFQRLEADWMRSCYHQHLKHRSKFYSLQSFIDHIESPWDWSQKLEKPYDAFGKKFVLVPYTKELDDGVNALLSIAGMNAKNDLANLTRVLENASPSSEIVEQLERINLNTEFAPTAWFAKKLILNGWKPKLVPASETEYLAWPPDVVQEENVALTNLMKRTKKRVAYHDISDILPEQDVDLEAMLTTYLPDDVLLPDASRQCMEDQSEILRYHLRGKTCLSHLNGLAISYLRRDTMYTQKARHLFHRIWEEHGVSLVNELPTRWLISTLQTFYDHGKSENQRLVGAAAYFYANMLKIYETERSIEGLQADAAYENKSPQTRNMFRGLDRFSVGGSDLVLNTNALALEIASKDDVAGLVFQEFLLRVKSSKNVFSRLDRTRVELGVETKGFTDTWSFFEEPGV